MSVARSYQASRVKRVRSTKRQVDERRDAIYEIVAEQWPMTVRQTFYRAAVRGVVEKSERPGYGMVQTDLVLMRRNGRVPYSWLTDSTRWQRKPNTYRSVKEALSETATLYRKALWTDVGAYVEVWLEKDALAGVIYPITSQFDVPLMVARGYASLTFLHEAAEYIASLDRPAFIYHLGDFDPSGVNAGEKIEQTLRQMAPEAEIHFQRLAVTPDQIVNLDLPTRPTKKSDSRSKGFGPISVELDAIPPDRLRLIVREAIEQHLPPRQFEILKAAEKSEQRLIRGLVGMLAERGEL
jgi:hypothetical protein